MKKIIIIMLLFTLILGGCNNVKELNNDMQNKDMQNKDAASSTSDNSEVVNEKDLELESQEKFDEFMKLVEGNKLPLELILFIKENITHVNKSTMDKMIDELILTQGAYLAYYNEKLYSDEMFGLLSNYDLEQLQNAKDISEEKLKSFIEEITSSGYIINAGEGYYIEINPQYLLDEVSKYISQEMIDYLNIMALETNKHFAVDAGLSINWNELADRIIIIEEYLNKYTDSIHVIEIQYLGNIYLRAYISGIDNTPVFNYLENSSSPKLYEDVKESYERTIDEYNGSSLAAIIQDYLDILERSNYVRSEEVESFINKTVTFEF